MKLKDAPRMTWSLSDLVISPTRAEKQHNGEKFITCDRGHKHWGSLGAAGILIRAPRPDGKTAYLLQKRGQQCQDNPGKWATFGGALLPGETPEEGARREVQEELGNISYQLGLHYTDDHGGWRYTIFAATAPEPFWPPFDGSTPEESADWGWHTLGEMTKLKLHPGFRKQLTQVVKLERAEKRFNPLEPRGAHGEWVLSGDKLWQSDAGRNPSGYTAAQAAIANEMWHGAMYTHTQSYLRDNIPFDEDDDAENARYERKLGDFRDMVTSTPPLEHPIETHRGIHQVSDVFGPVGSRIGKSFTDKGFTATTANPQTALAYGRALMDPDADYAILHYHVPAGNHVLRSEPEFFQRTGVPPEEANNTHREYTLPPGVTAEVTRDYVSTAGDSGLASDFIAPDAKIRHIHVQVM